jgi:putative exporter of polyketide antibiotics
MDLSPFAHSPIAPGPNPDYSGIPWLLAATAVLLGAGLWRFTRRDVAST